MEGLRFDAFTIVVLWGDIPFENHTGDRMAALCVMDRAPCLPYQREG